MNGLISYLREFEVAGRPTWLILSENWGRAADLPPAAKLEYAAPRRGTRTLTRGSGACPLEIFFKFVSLKCHFPHSDGTFEQKLNI